MRGIFFLHVFIKMDENGYKGMKLIKINKNRIKLVNAAKYK